MRGFAFWTVASPPLGAVLGIALGAAPAWADGPPPWSGFAADAQHTAPAPAAPQPFTRIRWTTPVDDKPQLSGDELLIHYASAMITRGNTVLLPVKGTATGGFRIEAHAGATGTLLWRLDTNYVLPPHDWVPPLPAALSPLDLLEVAGAGGIVIARATPHLASGAVTRTAFYGKAAYIANKARFDAGLFINTPLTADASGNLYFGFIVTGSGLTDDHGVALQSGIARLDATGTGTWVAATTAAGDAGITQVAQNAAPALSNDGTTIYVAVSDAATGAGYLLALDSATLATKGRVGLIDPYSGWAAWLHPDSSASPTVGPDGDVYFGVLEQPFPDHHDRGWLLHFDATLAITKLPGSFGWDNTVSVVPASSIPSYTGGSPYLLMTKYNDYIEAGGTGLNRIAVIDPGHGAPDPVLASVQVMATVESVLGPTKFPGEGDATYEWCINSAVVHVAGGTTIANSEDGHLYHWNLQTGLISESILLNAPRPEAYTMTVIGPDGTVYAINNATFYAVGK
jgi:hypothetical protein